MDANVTVPDLELADPKLIARYLEANYQIKRCVIEIGNDRYLSEGEYKILCDGIILGYVNRKGSPVSRPWMSWLYNSDRPNRPHALSGGYRTRSSALDDFVQNHLVQGRFLLQLAIKRSSQGE